MPDPRYRHVERRNRSSAFWSIVVVFVVTMLGVVAYGYHGIHSMQTSSSSATSPESTNGQSTRAAPARVPTATP